MSDDYVSKLQKDLMTKLNHLCLMHNEPALYVTEHFAELRRQVDLEAEKQIEIVREKDDEDAIANFNGKRMEFINILKELEKRTDLQAKPEIGSSVIYASLKQRVEVFKYSSRLLDDLEDSYVTLVREILDEIERVERRLLGDQTIIFCPHEYERDLGSLVYFGDVFLCQRDINYLLSRIYSYQLDIFHFQSSVSNELLVPLREPNKINKSNRVVQSLPINISRSFAKKSKFYYIAKTEKDYSSYLTEESLIDKEFISYPRKETEILQIQGDSLVDTSENLFDIHSSTKCTLMIENRRLESIHANLLPSPFDSLTELILVGVHFESFDTSLLSQFNNLTELKIQATYSNSKHVKFDLEFLRPQRQLKTLELTLPGSSWDFSVFKELYELRNLKLEGSSFFYAEKLQRLSKETLRQILSAPGVENLELSCFDIEAFDRNVFKSCRRLARLELARSRINDSDSVNFGFPLCFIVNPEENSSSQKNQKVIINFIHSDIRALSAMSFAEMRNLRRLTLTGSLIVDLPCGLFQDLPSLKRLYLNSNRIRNIGNGVFGKLDKLETLKLSDNPIETIEANAFAQLNNLRVLSMEGCRLKSIDSEMFKGLKDLRHLFLNDNLIERIEVVTEDGRRINVAKANLSDEEKELVNKQLFTDLSRLSILQLDGNKLEKIDLNCFSNLKGVTFLYLSSNKINKLSGDAGPELLSSLSNFFLNNNQLTTINQIALPKCVCYLNLAKNHLKRLDDDFFAQFSQLIEVNLSANELTWTITEATFAGCSQSLRRINLSMNESIQVTEGAFTNMSHLEHIHYDFSGKFYSLAQLETLRIRRLTPEIKRALKEFPRDELSQLRQLKKCYVSGCSIRTLTRNSEWKEESELDETQENLCHFNLSWLPRAPKLYELDLSENLMETLDDPELFADFESIYKINLSGNRLSRIHRDIFKCLPLLGDIDLSGNRLSSIDMGLFRHLNYLKDLDLSSNNISFVSLARLFRVCPELRSLNIADNQLDDRSIAEQIESTSSSNLESLVLTNNRFEKMDFVRDMTRLKHLDLRDNQIESVMSINGENLLGRLRWLTYLNLSRNKISTLKDEMFANLHGKLNRLDISENPALDSLQHDSLLSELI